MNPNQNTQQGAPALTPPSNRDLRDLRKTIWPLLWGKGIFHFHSRKMTEKVGKINWILFCEHHKDKALEVFRQVIKERIDKDGSVDFTTTDIGGETGTLLSVTIS